MRLLFLENIGLQLEKAEFGINHLKKLWNILVKESITDVERTQFLNWMMKSKERNGERKYTIKDSLMKSFFLQVLCDPEQTDNYKIYTPEIFRCFEKYFQLINEREENLVLHKGTERVIRYEKLIGLEVIWKIFLNCTNKKVLQSVNNILVNLHLKVYTNILDYKLAIWQKFVDKALDCIHKGKETKNHALISETISLINSFVVSFDGKMYLNKPGPEKETISFIVADKNSKIVSVVYLTFRR